MKPRFLSKEKLLENYIVSKDGTIISRKTMRTLTHRRVEGGYLRASLTFGSDKRSCFVHRIVAIVFISNPKNKPFVNHLDGNKANNDVNNLEWVTPKENSYHAAKKGFYLTINENNTGRPKLTEQKVYEIRIKLKNGVPRNELAELYNVSRSNINMIAQNKSWKQVKI